MLCKTLGIARKETEQIIAATKHDIDVMSRTLSIMEYDCEHMGKLDKNPCGRHEKYSELRVYISVTVNMLEAAEARLQVAHGLMGPRFLNVRSVSWVVG